MVVHSLRNTTLLFPPVLANEFRLFIGYSGQAVAFITHTNLASRFYPLKPKDPYSGRTAPLTSYRCILYIYSTNIGTEYFKHGIYSPFFSSSNCSLIQHSNVFGSCIIHISYTGCAKIKKIIIPAPKG